MKYDPIKRILVEENNSTKTTDAKDVDMKLVMEGMKHQKELYSMPNTYTMILGIGREYSNEEKKWLREIAKFFDIDIPANCRAGIYRKQTKDSNFDDAVKKYFDSFEGKSKSEVEKIVAKAKGNPAADEAYKKYLKSIGTKDAKTKDNHYDFIETSKDGKHKLGYNGNKREGRGFVVFGPKNSLWGYKELSEFGRSEKSAIESAKKKFHQMYDSKTQDAKRQIKEGSIVTYQGEKWKVDRLYGGSQLYGGQDNMAILVPAYKPRLPKGVIWNPSKKYVSLKELTKDSKTQDAPSGKLGKKIALLIQSGVNELDAVNQIKNKFNPSDFDLHFAVYTAEEILGRKLDRNAIFKDQKTVDSKVDIKSVFKGADTMWLVAKKGIRNAIIGADTVQELEHILDNMTFTDYSDEIDAYLEIMNEVSKAGTEKRNQAIKELSELRKLAFKKISMLDKENK